MLLILLQEGGPKFDLCYRHRSGVPGRGRICLVVARMVVLLVESKY